MRRLVIRPGLAILVGLWAGAAVAQVDFWKHEWPNTDFSRSSVKFIEILSGGPPRDGIPAIDNPRFHAVSAETRLSDREPVLTLELAGQVPRAYPIRYLIWHEIVNDLIDSRHVSVTFCPLCNSAMVFDGQLGGDVLTFGVTGKLRNSDMIMYDRQSESWWQQALGEGIVGAHMGDQLVEIPSWMESWAEFRSRNPEALVMDQPATARDYGRNPYAGYDSSARPFLFDGQPPPHGIPPLARVIRVGNRAWPMARLAQINELTEAGLTITWRAGQASALDTARIASGKDVGSIRVRNASGRDLAHDVMFAFAFHAFFPDGIWMLGK
ncbi:MAG: DUF3179 domain-containing protein [Rhodobacteraceae bacterium]|nr:DUF3179 domain-containing protein [Paracoccaceae bacterium]